MEANYMSETIMCMHVNVLVRVFLSLSLLHTHTHTQTHNCPREQCTLIRITITYVALPDLSFPHSDLLLQRGSGFQFLPASSGRRQ